MPSLAWNSLTPIRALWVPVTAMTQRTTNGPALGLVELSTNKIMVPTFDFDASTAEYAQFSVSMPPSWDEGTVTFIPKWRHAATTTNFGVVWKMRALALSDDDAMDAAFGTAQSSSDTGGTTSDFYSGPESAAITAAGTPASSDMVLFEVYRDPAEGADTMAIDAGLIGLYVKLTFDRLTDA